MRAQTDPGWLVLAAAEVEVGGLRRALRDTPDAPTLVVAGVGPAGDAAARRALLDSERDVLNLGFAGALGGDLDPGSVVLTTDWVAGDPVGEAIEHADRELVGLLRGWLGGEIDVAEAPGLTVGEPFHDAESGRLLRARTGAATVEMEGARWARLAREAGRRFAAVRIVSDRADLALPRPRHELLTPEGGIRLERWIRSVGAGHRGPLGEWRALRAAQRDWRAALVALDRVSRILARKLSVGS